VATPWHDLTSNKLHNIGLYPNLPISGKHFKAHLTRREQTLYNRLYIGLINPLIPLKV